MCGIVGIWNLNGIPIEAFGLDQFTDSLAHRGPDGRGTYICVEANLGLGHRRLAILDLSPKGKQPMAYAGGRYWITYNGEIFNFLELREELEGLGHTFVTESDTEVILAAYLQWGESCQLKFNGMWAFAIWDRNERVLFISRDRFGIKPLHYFFDGKHFAFASEMKAFLALDWFRLEFNPRMLALAVSNYNRVEGGTEDCLLKGIKRLHGGHCLIIRPGKEPQIKRWWNTLDHLVAVPEDINQQAEQFCQIFFDACKIRMRSDVPLGTALSGGLDSSSVICAMHQIRAFSDNHSRLSSDWQKAFVATFPGTIQDERKFAEQVVQHVGARPTYKEMDPTEAVENLDQILFSFEEIYDIPTSLWMIYREIRKLGVSISMDGHGADELLGGYHFYPYAEMRRALVARPNLNRFYEMRATLQALYPRFDIPSPGSILRDTLTQGLKNNFLANSVRSLGRLGRSCLFPDYVPRRTDWLLVNPQVPFFPEWEADKSQLAHFDSLNKQLYFDFHYRFLPTILRNFDRCSMAHGVEIRAPFMDWRLVCFGFSLPASSKIGGGYTKLILRKAMQGILPEPIRTRKSKIGFASPLVDWYKGRLKAFVLDTVNSQKFLQSDIWNGSLIRQQVADSYAKGDFLGASRSWQYIQAMKLMQLFADKSNQTANKGRN